MVAEESSRATSDAKLAAWPAGRLAISDAMASGEGC